jgi:hypothetical protein
MLTVVQPSNDRQQPVRCLTVPEAASILGTTPDAIRSRLRRGKLLKEVGEDGTVYVRLEGDGHGDGRGGQSDGQKTVDSTVAYISSLKSQIDLLAEQVEMLKGELEDRKSEASDQMHMLKDELRDRKEEMQRRDMLIAQMNGTITELTRRLPELEAPSELREEPETASGSTEGVETPLAAEKRSWLARFFGL